MRCDFEYSFRNHVATILYALYCRPAREEVPSTVCAATVHPGPVEGAAAAARVEGDL